MPKRRDTWPVDRKVTWRDRCTIARSGRSIWVAILRPLSLVTLEAIDAPISHQILVEMSVEEAREHLHAVVAVVSSVAPEGPTHITVADRGGSISVAAATGGGVEITLVDDDASLPVVFDPRKTREHARNVEAALWALRT